jgi:hypothetical protein
MTLLSLFLQTEKFKVERYKRLPDRTWAWVTVGYFSASTMAEARAMARDASADKMCILRAVRPGEVARKK